MSPSAKRSAGLPGSPPGHTPWSRWATVLGKVVLTFALGGAGGWMLAQVGAPAPWLTGSMLAVAAAALSGLPLAMPTWIRTLAFVLLGISIGSAVTPEALGEVQAWPGSVCLLLLAVGATTAASAFHLTRVRGWDVMTARYCSLPGALSQVLVLAMRSGADLPRIVLAQSLRVFVLVALLPWLIPAQGEAGPAPIHAAVELTIAGSAAMLMAGLATGVLFDRLGIPGGALLGGMIASAVLHGTGMLEGRLPGPSAAGRVCRDRLRHRPAVPRRIPVPDAGNRARWFGECGDRDLDHGRLRARRALLAWSALWPTLAGLCSRRRGGDGDHGLRSRV